MTRSRTLAILATVLLATPCASDPGAARLDAHSTHRLVISGDLPRTGALTREELMDIGTVEGRWVHHEKDHAFRGVPLDVVLVHMGFARTDMKASGSKTDKASEWKKVVLATAADGFQVVHVRRADAVHGPDASVHRMGG